MRTSGTGRHARKLILFLLFALGVLALRPGEAAYAQTRQAPPAPQAFGHYFSETTQAVGGTFYSFWYNNGAVTRFGYPISPELQERSETDNKTYIMQYFERGILEWHPENRPPNNVLVSPVGTYLYKQRYPRGATGQQPNNTSGSVLFRESGKRLGGKFLDFWRKNNGQVQFGYPITDEFMQQSPTDGKTYRVQYFQRAIFELHPEMRPPADVMLVLAGSLRYEAKYLSNVRGRTGDRDGDNIADNADRCPKVPENRNKVFDLDGCPDTMQTLLIFAAEDINSFWAGEFRQAGIRYRPPVDFVAYTQQVRTACGPAVLNNAFYCPGSHGIYYDYNFLLDQLASDGDFAPVTILAHEWGHLVQNNLGIDRRATHTIELELQADCFAGAWAAHAGDEGLLEEGDLDEGANSLFKAGDDSDLPWFVEGAHGQPEQRFRAFEIGLEQGVDGCMLDGVLQ
ncbi:MAG TPA: neutral zinc metallopeptidase [Chloroflexia bacterium]|nr:neutral zinc metallopeptidase [Chloroflexia bacterium]